MIEFACASCGKRYQAPPKLAGRRLSCHQCGVKLTIPRPNPPEEEEVLEVLPTEEEEVLEALPAEEDVLEIVSDAPAPRKKKKRGLILEGKNGVVELRGRELIIYHDGGSGYNPIFDRRVRPGTYKHSVLAVTNIEITPAEILGKGIIRFVLGHERKDPGRCCPIIDEQAITFGYSQNYEVIRFKVAVEKMKRIILEQSRMY